MHVLLKTKNLLLELRPGSTEAFQNGTATEQQVSDHCGRSRKCVEAYLGRFNLQSQTSTDFCLSEHFFFQ